MYSNYSIIFSRQYLMEVLSLKETPLIHFGLFLFFDVPYLAGSPTLKILFSKVDAFLKIICIFMYFVNVLWLIRIIVITFKKHTY